MATCSVTTYDAYVMPTKRSSSCEWMTVIVPPEKSQLLAQLMGLSNHALETQHIGNLMGFNGIL